MIWFTLLLLISAMFLLLFWVRSIARDLQKLARTAAIQSEVNEGLAATAELHNIYLLAVTKRLGADVEKQKLH